MVGQFPDRDTVVTVGGRIAAGWTTENINRGHRYRRVLRGVVRRQKERSITDRPNEATHDRGNGATGKRAIRGLGLVSHLVDFAFSGRHLVGWGTAFGGR